MASSPRFDNFIHQVTLVCFTQALDASRATYIANVLGPRTGTADLCGKGTTSNLENTSIASDIQI